MKNIELSACEEMIMTIIWNNEAELDLAAYGGSQFHFILGQEF